MSSSARQDRYTSCTRSWSHIGPVWKKLSGSASGPASTRGSRSGSPGALISECATSTRKPSAPRSSQNRSTDRNSSRTSGFSQFQSGCLVSNRCRYHWPGVPSGLVVRVQAGPRKQDSQLFGGSSPCSPRPSRKMYRSRSGEPGAAARAGLEPDVLVGGVVGHQVDDHLQAECVRPAPAVRRSRPACRRPGRRRGSRRRRSRRRPAGRCRTATARSASTPSSASAPSRPVMPGRSPIAVPVGVGE